MHWYNKTICSYEISSNLSWSAWGSTRLTGWFVMVDWVNEVNSYQLHHFQMVDHKAKYFITLWVVVWQIFSNKHVYILSIDATGGFTTISQHSNNTCVQQLYIPYQFWVSRKVCIYTHILFCYKWWLSSYSINLVYWLNIKNI